MVVLSGFLPLHSPAVGISRGLVHIPGSVPRGHFTLGRLEVVSAVGLGIQRSLPGLFPFFLSPVCHMELAWFCASCQAFPLSELSSIPPSTSPPYSLSLIRPANHTWFSAPTAVGRSSGCIETMDLTREIPGSSVGGDNPFSFSSGKSRLLKR